MPPIEDMKKYYKLYKSGRSIMSIAQEFKFNRNMLTRWFKKLNYEIRPKKLDLIGKKFNHFEVIENITKSGDREQTWKCRCICGNTRDIGTGELNNKEYKSCGCKRLQGYGKICKEFWTRIQTTAKRRNIIFDISIKDAWGLYEKQNGKCYFSNCDISFCSNIKKAAKRLECPQTASLDRLDSSLPYTKNNCVWVHKNVNVCKWTLREQEFISLCKLVANNFPNVPIIEIDNHYICHKKKHFKTSN